MTTKQLAGICDEACTASMREREEIAVEAIKRHGQPTLSGADVIRVGLILNEIQDQTFNLGVRYGMDLLFKALRQSTETQ